LRDRAGKPETWGWLDYKYVINNNTSQGAVVTNVAGKRRACAVCLVVLAIGIPTRLQLELDTDTEYAFSLQSQLVFSCLWEWKLPAAPLFPLRLHGAFCQPP
jgi:hypothetical protein